MKRGGSFGVGNTTQSEGRGSWHTRQGIGETGGEQEGASRIFVIPFVTPLVFNCVGWQISLPDLNPPVMSPPLFLTIHLI